MFWWCRSVRTLQERQNGNRHEAWPVGGELAHGVVDLQDNRAQAGTGQEHICVHEVVPGAHCLERHNGGEDGADEQEHDVVEGSSSGPAPSMRVASIRWKGSERMYPTMRK